MCIIKYLDIDECESSPCGTNHTCLDDVNGYKCSCLASHTGDHCETGKDLKVTCRGIFMLFFKLGKGCPIKHLKRYKSEINKKIQNKKYPKCFFLLITNRGKLACIIIGYVYIFCVFICRWTNNLHGCVIVCGFFVVMCGGQERQPNHHVFAPIIYSLHREAAKVFKKIFWEILSQEEKIFFSFFVSYGSNAPVVIQPDWEKNSRCFQGPLLNFQGVKLAIMPINHEKNYCMATNKYWLLTKL